MLVWLMAFLIFAFGIATPSFAVSYNTAGGLVIDQPSGQAVANSPALVSCDDEPKLCANPEGPGNSQNAPVGPPNGGPGPHSGH